MSPSPNPHIPVLGIDLGSAYSCAAVHRHGQVEVIPRPISSFVSFRETGRATGEGHGGKGIIGRAFDDPAEKAHSKKISSMILTDLKKTTEGYLSMTVTDAVVSVPAYFNHSQRQATRDAGEAAGLNVVGLLDEPLAAVLAYGLHTGVSTAPEGRNVLVFDLGRGNCDASILSIKGGAIEVLCAANDDFGGDDFDWLLTKYLAAEFNKKTGLDMTRNPRSMRRLQSAVEKTKRCLSSLVGATVECESLFDGVDLHTKVSRAKFEAKCKELFKRSLILVAKALEDAKKGKGDIHDVVLVGGSTRIPKLRAMLSEFFDDKVLTSTIDPEEVVARGAALQGAVLAGDDPWKSLELINFDVTPLSLGLQTVGGAMTTIIRRNTIIPCQRRQMFSTVVGNLSAVDIRVLEGERALARDNHLLGGFRLTGIPTADSGPQIEVTFAVDANGILTVSALDVTSGKGDRMSFSNGSGRPSNPDIDQMVEEAREFAKEDEQARAALPTKAQLEALELPESLQGRDDSSQDH